MKVKRTINDGCHEPNPIHRLFNEVVERVFPNPPNVLLARYAFILLLLTVLLPACERPGPVQEEKGRTLTADERYIVKLYMKITEIEENLQDNTEEQDKKWDEVRREFDPEKVRRILEELEKDPKRWLAVYGRINELLRRRSTDQPT